jgi:type VI secretion system secreted protein VgrG
VTQPALSGSQHLPRVGWEVVLGFQGASEERPFVLGRLFNGAATPPVALPANKVVTRFGSLSTPGGGGENVIEMNDAAGNEGMRFHASKDMNERTENDKKTSVTADDAHQVGSNRTVLVGAAHQLGVGGAQTRTVGGNRTVNVDANKSVNSADETVMIGGLRVFNVGGDYLTGSSTMMRLVGAARAEAGIEHVNRQVTGASTVMVGGSMRVAGGPSVGVVVGGVNNEVVGGAKTVKTPSYTLKVSGALNQTFASHKVKAGGDQRANFGGAASITVSGSGKMQGSDVVFEADSSLTLVASGVTVKITPSAVTIEGDFKGSVESVDDGDEQYG